MWVHVFLEARLLGGFLARVPDHPGGDRCITGMPAVAWLGLCRNPRQCTRSTSSGFPVFASFAALDVNHHAFAIDVADFQVCQFTASYSGGVEGHQQSAIKRS